MRFSRFFGLLSFSLLFCFFSCGNKEDPVQCKICGAWDCEIIHVFCELCDVWDCEIDHSVELSCQKGGEEKDEFFHLQWYLDSESDSSVNILGAWEITRGAGVKIAVLDDGVQKTHEDLRGISVYDVRSGGGVSAPGDLKKYSHGTAVSGVAAGRRNCVGIIGVAPESDVLFIGDINLFADADLIKATQYAKNWGARVINCSWGSGWQSPIFVSQMKNLYDNGVVVVFATCNDGRNWDLPPPRPNDPKGPDESELEWVIGVSASDRAGNRSINSGYGSKIDIMAPGVQIIAPDLMGTDGSNNHNGLANDNYGFRNGTSFAAPIVAGVAALMLSANPALSPAEVRQIITQTAQKTGEPSMYDANGFSLYHAHGLIDATRATRRAAGLPDLPQKIAD